MCGVEPTLGLKVASMHLEGPAACWFQSAERRLHSASWDTFCALVHDRFGRDQHEALIHQLFHIRQVGLVAEYVEQFSTLIDQLATYEADANPLHRATRFVDGLHDDIKSVVMIQRPSTLDIACAHALVQEEAADADRKRDFQRSEPFSNRSVQRFALSLSAAPRLDKSSGSSVGEDKKSADATSARVNSTDDKLRALKQYRRT
jgi:hypothetical protein